LAATGQASGGTARAARLDSLVVLSHALQGPPRHYYLSYLLDLWRAEGRRVVLHQGLGEPPPAAAALLHVDLTVCPEEYRALAARYPLALNRHPASLAKRVVSRNLVARDDAYEGPVIVKTDLNAGGLPEQRLALAGRSGARRAMVAARRRLPLWLGGLPVGTRYRIYPRKQEVPAAVWSQPALVVERLLLDRVAVDGRRLCGVRQWFCLGGRGLVLTYRGVAPCLRWDTTTLIEPLSDAVPEAIRARRRELGLDFGKLDFVVVDGEAHLLDANRTPFLGGPPWSETTDRICRTLAAGLDDYAD
jgi:hypothetical protein